MKKIIILLVCMMIVSIPTLAADAEEISTDGWTFEANSTAPNTPYEMAADGNMDTYWHSLIDPKQEPPHIFTIIFPKETEISGIVYYPRPDNGPGIFMDYELYIEKGDEWKLVKFGSMEGNTDVKPLDFGFNVTTKKVKVVAITTTQGYATIAEIAVLGKNSGYKTPTDSELDDIAKDRPVLISRDGFSATASSEQGGLPITNIIDGSSQTIWHSEFSPNLAKFPITVTIDLGGIFSVSSINYFPRPDSDVGRWKETKIYASENGNDFKLVKEITFDDQGSSKMINFDTTRAKYFKFEIVSSYQGHAVAAELQFYQSLKDQEENEAKNFEEYILKIGSKDIVYRKQDLPAETVTMDVAPMIYRDRTMIPLRTLLEAMGAKVEWFAEREDILITKGDTKIKLRIEDDVVYKNDIRYNLDVCPMIENERTLIPLRFVSELLNYKVEWEPTEKMITIRNKN